MSKKKIYDVVIVGAGPAGSFLAYQLADSGLNTLILEKEKFPRFKICAGGLPAKVLNLIPFDLEPIIEERIHKISLIYKLKTVFTKGYEEPLIFTVNRERFDTYIVEKAIEAGAEFLEGHRVVDVEIKDRINVIRTELDDFRACIVVGADGVNGVISRILGLKPYTLINLGILCKIPFSILGETAFYKKGGITLDLGTISNGYGWIFPKANGISVGIKGCEEYGRSLKQYLYDFLHYNHLEDSFTNPYTYPIPCRIGKGSIHKDNFILIGDAAGLTDPWTGEGIFYALKSAMLAACAIQRYFRGNIEDFRTYEDFVDKEIARELRASHGFSKIFDRFPWLFYTLLENSEYFWDLFCRSIRGDKTFTEISERLKLWYIVKKIAYLAFH